MTKSFKVAVNEERVVPLDPRQSGDWNAVLDERRFAQLDAGKRAAIEAWFEIEIEKGLASGVTKHVSNADDGPV